MKPLLRLSAFCLLMIVCSGLAISKDDGLEEIVVTALKREQSLTDVGEAVSVLTAADLRARGVDDLENLQFQIPGLNVGQQLGAARIAIRGVGLDNINPGAEGSIAFHSDGIFYSRPAAALGTFFDVERIEVLRGPQGTLYGRNATGGSVNIISRKPTAEPSGYLTVARGNYDSFMAEGALSSALIGDSVLGRLAVKAVERGGYGHNLVTGNPIDDSSTRAVRGQLQFVASEQWSALLRAEYFRANDHDYGYHFINPFFADDGTTLKPLGPEFGGVIPSNPRDVANNTDPKNHRDRTTLSLEIEGKWGAMRVTALTGYQESSFLTQSDLDVSSALLAPLAQSEDASQISQELRFSFVDERWNALAGAYYFQERVDGFFDVALNNALFSIEPAYLSEGYFAGGRIDTKAYAVFGEAQRLVGDRTRITLGARYSYETKRGEDRFRFDVVTPDVPGPGRAEPPILARPADDFSAFTPRLALEYQLGERELVYASASRGFKAGAINLGGLQPPVRPERVWAYEAGLRADTFDRRLRTGIAGFYYDYTDLQVGQVRNSVVVLENAATARIYGLEAEITAAPTKHVRFNMVGSWLHARYTDFITQDQARPGRGNVIDPATGQRAFQLAGNQLVQAPEFSLNIGAQYEWTTRVGNLSVRAEVVWMDDIYYTPFNLPSALQPAHTKENAFVNWMSRQGTWSGQLFVRNIDNGRDLSNVFVSSTLVGSSIIGSYEEPRTFGARLTYHF